MIINQPINQIVTRTLDQSQDRIPLNWPMRRQEWTDRCTDDGPRPIRSKFADMRFICWDLKLSANQRPALQSVDQSEQGKPLHFPNGTRHPTNLYMKTSYLYDEIITLIFCVPCSSLLCLKTDDDGESMWGLNSFMMLFLKHPGLHWSKEQKMMSPLQWWVRQLTSGTRIRIARSPRPRGGLLLWEAGIMTRVTQTIYNPGNAELWLVRSANPGLWLARTWSSISSKNVFKINHSYTKIYLQRETEKASCNHIK